MYGILNLSGSFLQIKIVIATNMPAYQHVTEYTQYSRIIQYANVNANHNLNAFMII